jgi:hypothetical protein
MFSFKLIASIALASLFISGHSFALADATAKTTGIDGNAVDTSAASGGSLSGGVENHKFAGALSAQTGNQQLADKKESDEAIRHALKNVADSAHHMQERMHDIIYEITRQEYVTAGEPNVVGPTVIPAIPMPTGTIAMGGYLAPRKKYMDFFAAQTKSLLTMLIEEGSNLPSTLPRDANMSAKLSMIKGDLNALQEENNSLQPLMIGPTYDNLKIGRQALLMSSKLDDLKKLLKDSERSISKDIKHDPE